MITLTEKAVSELSHIISEQEFKEDTPLRIGIKGGGCSGFSYVMNFDHSPPEDEDTVVETGGMRVLIDRKSLTYIEGLIVDFQEDLMQRGFVFNNPTASGTCGCGTSFSV
jgi:iron-sulfur cluster assembly protein